MLIGALQVALVFATTEVLKLPLPNPTENYTEEVWLYFKEPVADEPFYALYEPDRSAVQISKAGVRLNVYLPGGTVPLTFAEDKEVLPKLRRWMHIATRYSRADLNMKCAVLVNGFGYACKDDVLRSNFKVSMGMLYWCRSFPSNITCSGSLPTITSGGTTFITGTTVCGTVPLPNTS